MVFLKNRDEVPGKLKSMNGRTVVINSLGADLTIPLERITRVALTKPEAKPEAKRPWEVRAHFAGGAAVSFDLQPMGGQHPHRPQPKLRPGDIRLAVHPAAAVQPRHLTKNQRHQRRRRRPTLALG